MEHNVPKITNANELEAKKKKDGHTMVSVTTCL